MTRARRTGATLLSAAALLAPFALGAGVAGAVGQRVGTSRVTSSTLSVALPVGSVPTSVFPFYSVKQCTSTNIDFWDLDDAPGVLVRAWQERRAPAVAVTLNPATITTTGANTTISFSVKGGSGPTALAAPDDDRAGRRVLLEHGQGAEPIRARTRSAATPRLRAARPGRQRLVPRRPVRDPVTSSCWATRATIGCSTTSCQPDHPAREGVGHDRERLRGLLDRTRGDHESVIRGQQRHVPAVFNYLSGLQIDNPLWEWSDGPYRQTGADSVAGRMATLHPGRQPRVQRSGQGAGGPRRSSTADAENIAPEITELQSNKLDIGVADTGDVSKSPGPAWRATTSCRTWAATTPKAA